MLDGAGHRCGCSGGPCSFRAEVLILFPGSGSASQGRRRERTAANVWCLNSLWSISRMRTWPFQSVSWLQLHILDLWDFKRLVNLQNDKVYIKRLPIVNINMVLGWKPNLDQEYEYVDWKKLLSTTLKKCFECSQDVFGACQNQLVIGLCLISQPLHTLFFLSLLYHLVHINTPRSLPLLPLRLLLVKITFWKRKECESANEEVGAWD